MKIIKSLSFIAVMLLTTTFIHADYAAYMKNRLKNTGETIHGKFTTNPYTLYCEYEKCLKNNDNRCAQRVLQKIRTEKEKNISAIIDTTVIAIGTVLIVGITHDAISKISGNNNPSATAAALCLIPKLSFEISELLLLDFIFLHYAEQRASEFKTFNPFL